MAINQIKDYTEMSSVELTTWMLGQNVLDATQKVSIESLLASVFMCGRWNSAVSYALNVIVEYNGVLYKSLQASNLNKDPETEDTWWEPAGGSSGPIWEDTLASDTNTIDIPDSVLGGKRYRLIANMLNGLGVTVSQYLYHNDSAGVLDTTHSNWLGQTSRSWAGTSGYTGLESASPRVGWMSANEPGYLNAILDCAGPRAHQLVHGTRDMGADMMSFQVSNVYQATAPTTFNKIRLYSIGATGFKAGSTFSLWEL